MPEYRNARWHDAEHTTIIAEVNHPSLGWIPTGLRGDCPETGEDFATLAAGAVAAYAPASLESLREAASLTRQEFCLALKRAGVLSGPDAIDAAKGNWPAAFDAALPLLTASGVDADEAQIIWASANLIERTHPMLSVLSQVAGLSDAQVDALFGIGG